MKKMLPALLAGLCSIALSAGEYRLSELLELAVRNDNRLEAIHANIAAAETRKADAYAAYQPRVSGSAKVSYISEAPSIEIPIPGVPAMSGQNDSYSAALSVSQLLFGGMARMKAADLTRNALSMEMYNGEKRTDELKFLVVQAAYGFRLATLSLESLDASLARLEINKRRVNSFRNQGLASELDVLEIDGSLDELMLRRAAQEGEMNRSRIALESLTGAADISAIVFDGLYLDLSKDTITAIGQMPVAANAELQTIDFALSAASIRKSLDMAAFYPSAAAFGSLQYGKPGTNSFSDEWEFYYTGGIEVKMDFWDGGSRFNAIKRDNAKIDELKATKREMESNLDSGKAQNIQVLIALERQYDSARSLHKTREEKYEIIQRLWQAGQKTTLDVLAAEQELTEAELMQKQLEIRRLSKYQDVLKLINRPVWKTQE